MYNNNIEHVGREVRPRGDHRSEVRQRDVRSRKVRLRGDHRSEVHQREVQR